MSKNDWGALQRQFERDNAKTGIKPKQWCETNGLNYQTARRYIKVRKSAQNGSAQNAQKRSSQNEIAQDSQADISKKKSRNKSPKNRSNSTNSAAGDSNKPHMEGGREEKAGERDERGRFRPGHSVSVGNAGNTGEPTNAFKPGNQNARKSGMYSRFFDDKKKELFDYSEFAELSDELALTRARLQFGIEFLNKIVDDIGNAKDVEQKIKLYEMYQKTENRLDVLTGRVESITKTLSNLRIDAVTEKKIVEDTKRIKNASRKLSLEADDLQKQGKGDDTPIADIVSDIQSMGKSGLMSE